MPMRFASGQRDKDNPNLRRMIYACKSCDSHLCGAH
jgi:hypothetical protein